VTRSADANFRVLIHGRDVVVDDERGQLQRCNFYVPVFVRATDRESAIALALSQLRAHPKFRALRRWPPESPREEPIVQVSDVDPVPDSKHPQVGTAGFIYYEHDQRSNE
jgi:hypothetical protein